MNVDDALQSLRDQPRPEPSPFFAAKVAHTIRERQTRRTPPAMIAFWLLLVCFSAAMLLPTSFGVPLAVLAIGGIVFPEKVIAVFAPLLR
jgi:hypothetical protein